MRTYRLILIGFGNVGQGFAQILREQGEELAAQGLQAVIVAVSDLLKGSVYRPAGFSPAELLDTVQAGKSLETLDATAKGWDARRTIAECEADVLVLVLLPRIVEHLPFFPFLCLIIKMIRYTNIGTKTWHIN